MATTEVIATQTREGGLEVLRELKADLQGTAATLHLFRSDFVPGPEAVEADFEAAECDFDTYAAAALVYGVVGIDGSGRVTMHSGDVPFQNIAGTAGTPGGDQVGGAWIHLDDAGPPLVDAAVQFFQFPAPVDLSEALATMTVDVVQVSDNAETYVIVET